MKKLLLVISICLMMVGCTKEEPKDVVENFFISVNSGDLKSAEQYCDYSIVFGQSEYADIEKLYSSLAKNVTSNFVSEKIDKNDAEVIVEVTKVDYDKAYDKAKELVSVDVNISEKEKNKLINEKIIELADKNDLPMKKSKEIIDLVKFDNKWFITNEQNFEKILFL